MTGFLRQVRPRTTLVFHQPLYGVDSYRAKSMPLVRRLSRETGLPVGCSTATAAATAP